MMCVVVGSNLLQKPPFRGTPVLALLPLPPAFRHPGPISALYLPITVRLLLSIPGATGCWCTALAGTSYRLHSLRSIGGNGRRETHLPPPGKTSSQRFPDSILNEPAARRTGAFCSGIRMRHCELDTKRTYRLGRLLPPFAGF
jgi:hypothetical protein